MMPLALALHVLAAVVWVGGMFFAYAALRPSAGRLLEPAPRVALWAATLGRFFAWVWAAVAVLLVTGYWMVFAVFGGFAAVGVHVHVMNGLGIVMMLIFAHVYLAPYRRLRRAVAEGDVAEAGRRLGQIRWLVAANLALGLIVVAVASGGRFLA